VILRIMIKRNVDKNFIAAALRLSTSAIRREREREREGGGREGGRERERSDIFDLKRRRQIVGTFRSNQTLFCFR